MSPPLTCHCPHWHVTPTDLSLPPLMCHPLWLVTPTPCDMLPPPLRSQLWPPIHGCYWTLTCHQITDISWCMVMAAAKYLGLWGQISSFCLCFHDTMYTRWAPTQQAEEKFALNWVISSAKTQMSWPPLPPRFCSNNAVFRQFEGEKPYFEHILGSAPPLCFQNSALSPDQNPGSSPGSVFAVDLTSCKRCLSWFLRPTGLIAKVLIGVTKQNKTVKLECVDVSKKEKTRRSFAHWKCLVDSPRPRTKVVSIWFKKDEQMFVGSNWSFNLFTPIPLWVTTPGVRVCCIYICSVLNRLRGC